MKFSSTGANYYYHFLFSIALSEFIIHTHIIQHQLQPIKFKRPLDKKREKWKRYKSHSFIALMDVDSVNIKAIRRTRAEDRRGKRRILKSE